MPLSRYNHLHEEFWVQKLMLLSMFKQTPMFHFVHAPENLRERKYLIFSSSLNALIPCTRHWNLQLWAGHGQQYLSTIKLTAQGARAFQWPKENTRHAVVSHVGSWMISKMTEQHINLHLRPSGKGTPRKPLPKTSDYLKSATTTIIPQGVWLWSITAFLVQIKHARNMWGRWW